ncbi:MAG: lipocalin family protein [Pseudomonadota bacterium]|nr:lipocalin family protein [Pseudomonadota bacterium]
MGGVLVILLTSCTTLPKGVQPVSNFELDRYLGQWHEIARLDHSFEKDLINVTATYSMREDGGVKVINRGFNTVEKSDSEAEGKAYFMGDESLGSLKVSFFGPFYGGYHIAKLSSDYQMALVIGPSLDYAWILARSAQPNKIQCDAFYNKAEELGISRDSWIEGHVCKA